MRNPTLCCLVLLAPTAFGSAPQERVAQPEQASQATARVVSSEQPWDAGLAEVAKHLEGGQASLGLKRFDGLLARFPAQPELFDWLAARRAQRTLGFQISMESLGLMEASDENHAAEIFEAATRKVQAYPPALRELSLYELRDWGYVELGPELCREQRNRWWQDRNPMRRRLASEWQRQDFERTSMGPLVQRSLLDPDDSVRLAAASALGKAKDPALVGPFVKALGHESEVIVKNAAEALGNMGYPQAVPALAATLLAPASSSGWQPPAAYIFGGTQSAYVQDFDVEVATGSAIADPIINVLSSGAVLEARVLHVSPKRLHAAVRTSLQRLTAQDPGKTAKAQRAWWENNRARYEALLESAPDPASGQPTSGVE